MSNIVTQQLRFVRAQGMREIDLDGLVTRLLGEGSYWVPLWVDRTSAVFLDVQLGSGKGAGLVSLEPEELAAFDEIWMRTSDDGNDFDAIGSFSPLLGETVLDARWSPCVYAFDRAEIDGRTIDVAGTYRALNSGSDMRVGARARGFVHAPDPAALGTRTTPCIEAAIPTSIEPAEVGAALARATRYTLWHEGRIVQRGQRNAHGRLVVQSADHWDNCADEGYRRALGTAFR